MIKVNVFIDGLYAHGHANQSNKGNDIVCSAVSAIIQGFIKSFDDNLIKLHVVDEGVPSIYFQTKKDISKEAINIVFTQLKCIEFSAKKHVIIKIKNNSIKEENYEK